MVKLNTVIGGVKLYTSVEHMLAELNRNGRWYKIVGDEVWHKGHNRFVGTFVL
jgi:hypothetical protein